MQLAPKSLRVARTHPGWSVHSSWGCAWRGALVEMPPVMKFSSPQSPTSPTLFNPHDEHQIVVAKAKQGKYAIGYMDRVVRRKSRARTPRSGLGNKEMG